MARCRIFVAAIALIVPQCTFAQTPAQTNAPGTPDLAEQIVDVMFKQPGVTAGFRPVHAKGIVCRGKFEPSADAAGLSKAAHFQGASVPVTVRFSLGSSQPLIPDNSPDVGPRGMAIRFTLPDGHDTDIVAMSHNGFIVGTGEEFLALQKAAVATDPSKPHPWPIEQFLGSHPRALKFVQDNRTIPASFATEAFFSNDSFMFVNRSGDQRAGRYKILPIANQQDLSDADAKAKAPNFLIDDIKARLASAPVKYRLLVQLANSGDVTSDPSLVWPDDRKTVDMGTISITATVPDNAVVEKELAFDPTNLAEGIEPSDDPLPALRSQVYALSVMRRRGQ
jgi:catalase